MLGLKLTKRRPISAKRFIDLEWTSLLGYGFYLYDDVLSRQEYGQWPDWKKEHPPCGAGGRFAHTRFRFIRKLWLRTIWAVQQGYPS